ncbi:MAG: recombinase family protein [Eubacteriales bacterium]
MPHTSLLNVAAAYIRVSDERQDEYSPDSQLKKIREYADREGYMIPEEYVFYDDGISAKTVKHRKEFNRMIALAKDKDHPFDRIYVWKFSRFARNQEESMVYKNLLKKKDVAVVSVSEPIPDGVWGSLIERIIEWMDEFYLINLSTEVTRGMTEKASRGEPTGPPPYGYVMRDKKYYPDESGPADVIRDVFRRFVAGEGMREIAYTIAANGVRTKFGNVPENRQIEYILHNPCYIGKIRWSLDGTRAAGKRDYYNEKIMIVDGHHEPLISMELWDAAQKRLEEIQSSYPRYARKDQPIDYTLKGLVRCSSCGGTLASSGTYGKQKIRLLQCCNYNRASCTVSHCVAIPKIEKSFISGLEEAIATGTFAISPPKPKEKTSGEPDYDKLIAAEERKLERAKEAYLAEIDTLEVYAKHKESITARIAQLQAQKESQSISPAFDPVAFTEKVKTILDFVRNEDNSPKAKNEAVRTIIEKVIYDKSNERLSIYFRV